MKKVFSGDFVKSLENIGIAKNQIDRLKALHDPLGTTYNKQLVINGSEIKVSNLSGTDSAFINSPKVEETKQEVSLAGINSYLLLANPVNVVEHVWPSDSSYEWDLEINVVDVSKTKATSLFTLLIPYVNLRGIVGSTGNLGFRKYTANFPIIWSETAHKFVVLVDMNFDTVNKTGVAFIDTKGNVSGSKLIWSRAYLADYSNIYLYVRYFEGYGVTTTENIAVLVRGYPDVATPQDRIIILSSGKLSTLHDYTLSNTLSFLLHKSGVTDVTKVYHNNISYSCYCKGGMIVNHYETGKLEKYPGLSITGTSVTLQSSCRPERQVAFIRYKNLIYLQGYSIPGIGDQNSQILDIEGNVLYEITPVAPATVYYGGGQEMLSSRYFKG